MKRCVAIRHLQFEDLGSFERPIRQAGYDIEYLDVATDDLEAAGTADLLVILGGPIGVYDEADYPFLNSEIALAEARLQDEKPILGICLGAQIMARAAGAKVYAGRSGKEIGWLPLRLSQEGSDSIIAPLGEGEAQMFHWHGDTFDLPDGATRLASTQAYANQIYSIGTHALAFQCHPELDPARIEHWLVGHACEIANAPDVNVQDIRDQTRLYGDDLMKVGQKMMKDWLAGLQT